MGLEHGYSMMVGGSVQAYETVQPLIEGMAQPGGYGHFGPTGAGHYVKMVHNAIEYGMMQAYAEGYRLMKEGGDYEDIDLGALAQVWQHGSIVKSGLNEIMQRVLARNPELDGIEGYVAESGEARWTIETAQSHDIPTPVFDAALQARIDSQNGHINFGTKLLAATRNGFGGHNINQS